jgi:hypothetical protein
VAKCWARFDNFLEILYVFGVGEEWNKPAPVAPVPGDGLETGEQVVAVAVPAMSEEERIGMEFLFKHKFIEKACDFLLGRKSPLSTPGDKRIEMGGSFTSPNFSPLLKLLTRMITC